MSGHAIYILGIFLIVSGCAVFLTARILLYRKMKQWKKEYETMYNREEEI